MKAEISRLVVRQDQANSFTTHQRTRIVVLLRSNDRLLQVIAANFIIAHVEEFGGPASGIVSYAWKVLGRPQLKPNLWKAA